VCDKIGCSDLHCQTRVRFIVPIVYLFTPNCIPIHTQLYTYSHPIAYLFTPNCIPIHTQFYTYSHPIVYRFTPNCIHIHTQARPGRTLQTYQDFFRSLLVAYIKLRTLAELCGVGLLWVGRCWLCILVLGSVLLFLTMVEITYCWGRVSLPSSHVRFKNCV
jgi:hypothetical protein